MASPRIRDGFTFLTTLPSSVVLTACLFLPHTRDCHHHEQTPWESGTWLAVVPMILIGLLPFLWHASRRVRRSLPEIMLMFTLIVMAVSVITIPVAIYLMWGYAKKQSREALVAMCGVACTLMFLLLFPLITMFDHWLPAAEMTWGCGLVELVGLVVWTSAALGRRVDELEFPLHPPLVLLDRV